MAWRFILFSGFFYGVCCFDQQIEPVCLSRFDYDYKLISKLISMEMELTKQFEMTKNLMDKVTDQTERIKTLEATIEKTSDNQNGASCGESGTSYIRWGRTTCPSNGTEIVYKGFAGGSHYTHKGAAVNYLCLPEEPVWDHFEDEADSNSAFIYGGEYQFDNRNRVNFFGKEVHQHDAPCAVCRTRRTTMIMIPGRNVCYDGWTLEYHGYLAGGFYNHEAASEFVCVDANLEVIPGSQANENGKLFYFTEVKCGSLKCPPYVANRELSCVVCSK